MRGNMQLIIEGTLCGSLVQEVTALKRKLLMRLPPVEYPVIGREEGCIRVHSFVG
jgi:hypothetical protein